jgi:hypothetical protein
MSTQFFVHLPDGQIVATGYCPVGQLAHQRPPVGAVRAGAATLDVHYWDEAAQAVRELPARPSQYHQFDYGAKAWVVEPQHAWQRVRLQRDALLAATDWRVARAAESGQLLAPQWQAYRQQLRDVTEQADPSAIVWPTMPSD